MCRVLNRQTHRSLLAVIVCAALCFLGGFSFPLAASVDAEDADYSVVVPDQGSKTVAVGAPEQFSSLVNQIIDINTRFAIVFIAIAAAIMLLVLLLLFRLGSIRNALLRSARDMSNTKEALRYLMDMDKQEAAKKPAQDIPARKEQAEDAARNEAAIARVMAEMEKLAKRMDNLPQAADEPPRVPAKKQQDVDDIPPKRASAKKRLYDEEDLTRELDRRLEALHIEIIEPAVGDKYDPLLHDEVDSKPSREELDGTIFRVIQNGLAYNNRVALKSRVVVHRA